MDLSTLKYSRKISPSPKNPRKSLTLFLSISIPTSILFLFVFLSSHPLKFSIVIDAGSSGTRIHIFGYKFNPDSRSIPISIDLDSTYEMRISPGLSAYVNDLDKAGEGLMELIEFGKRKVGREKWGETEVRLMATAGLRMIEDEKAREGIIESCRRVLRGSGFKFVDEWASVISGSDEGVYAWISTNYALGSIGGDPLETVGIMELGGASAQMTFVSDEPLPPEYTRMLKFGKKNYSLYTNSFLHFGQNVAYWSVQELLNLRHQNLSAESSKEKNYMDPCTPKGYSHNLVPSNNSAIVPSSNLENQLVHANGNFSECRYTAFTFLQKEKDQCMYQQCHLGSVFIPKLRGKFLGTENFFFTSQFFELGPAATVSDFMSAGQQFCGADWLGLEKKYKNVKNDILSQYCFSSAYIVALLHDSLGISMDDNRITYTNDVGNFQVDWALGAFIMHSLSNLEKEPSNWIYVTRKNSWVLLSLFVVSASFVFVAWLIVRWRRLQLKTVYDLEKGRYIVTRINGW